MLIVPRAILFDMDGTLTQPMLDFPLIKQQMGIGQRPILEALAEMNEDARQNALKILHGYEDNAAANSTLNPGCHELLSLLASHNIARAIITRNSIKSTRTVLALHQLQFQVLITRENGKYKPDPSPLLEACRQLSVDCAKTWMVGDGQYDVEAGRAAGAQSVWISHGRTREFSAEPDLTVVDLIELTRVLQDCLKNS